MEVYGWPMLKLKYEERTLFQQAVVEEVRGLLTS